jgi:hypothetical protein
MLIYRVHKNGTGPYENKTISLRYPRELEYFDNYLSDGSERNQQPETDNGTELQKFVYSRNFKLDDYVFGFSDKKHLFIWFSPVNLGYLYANGFGIWAYDVPESLVVKGNRQLCFRVDDAIWSKKLSLNEFRRIQNNIFPQKDLKTEYYMMKGNS